MTANRLLAHAVAASIGIGGIGGMAGCGGDEVCNDPADGQAFLTPSIIHSGFNGRNTYQAVLSANFSDFTATSRDTNVIVAERTGCLEQDASGIVAKLTAAGEGETTVRVISGEFRRTVEVVVTGYSADEYDLGEERYTGPADANGTDRIACNMCHQQGGGGAPHSPLALAGNSNAALVAAVTTSSYPDTCEDESGDLCSCTPVGESCASCSESDCDFVEGYTLSLAPFGGGPGDHVYDLTTDERTGITAYMRAIEPEGL